MSKPSTNALVGSLTALILGVGLGACSPKKDTAVPDKTGATACTEEAKVCDDGSSVAREGPDCEFAACPDEASADGAIDDIDDEPASDEPADETPSDEDAE